jgi:hypothetical protein
MTFRLPMLLHTLVVGGSPISVHLKAGDFAPDLVFTRMLNAGGATPRVPDKPTPTAALEGRLLHLNAEPPRMPRTDDHKPDFPPSYAVNISPAKTADGGDFSSNRFQNFQGVTLRHILAQVFDVNPVRILLPAALDDNKLYDVAIALPDPEPTEASPIALSKRFRIILAS